MAEASCSGSTPLKSLVDHHSRDGGLHGDRARVASLTPVNAFRSQQTAPAGQDGYSSFIQNEKLPHSEPLSGPHAPGLSHPSSLYLQQQPRWPAHQPSPTLNPQPAIVANGTRPSGSNWVTEYSSSASLLSHDQSSHAGLAPAGFSQQFITSPAFYAPMQGPGSTAAGLGASNRSLHPMETPAPAEMHLGDVDDALRQIAEELERSAYLEEHTEDEATRVVDAGTDVNQAVEEGNGKSSDVSEIAKKILDTVNHEDGVKWRESTFLALMRDFRDGKKVIVEDTVQDSDSSSKRD